MRLYLNKRYNYACMLYEFFLALSLHVKKKKHNLFNKLIVVLLLCQQTSVNL